MNSKLLPRMIALVVVVFLGVYYIAFDVMQYRVTSQPFPVTVLMSSAGGLYSGADVTYRGVQVGKVTALDLGPTEVSVKLGINAGQQIPDNGPVRVKELSALGEQYLDLQPRESIRTSTCTQDPSSPPVGWSFPHQSARRWSTSTRCSRSINPQDLQTDESFLASAFVGTGPDLRTIIVTGQQLFNSLVAAQPETVNLVVDGQTDLRTLEATDGDLATFAQGLASVTGQLRDSNADVQALIRNSQQAEQRLNPFLAADSTQITDLIVEPRHRRAGNRTNTARTPKPSSRCFPVVSQDLASVVGNGAVHGELAFNTEDPVCPYILGALIPGPTQTVTTLI